jgi:DNA-binding response OmpR family regulator
MSSSNTRVLIVDDEIFFLEAIDEILDAAGYETERAADGRTALEAACDPRVGVAVLDVRLPDMSGIEVLASLRERRPDVAVIMLSASTDQEIVLEALRLGACDYLAKPLHDEELSLAVERAIHGYEATTGLRRLRRRLERLVDGMERLAQLVRLASPEDRVEVLRQGIVDAAGVVLDVSRVSLMLADEDGEWLSVVAARGIDVELETLTSRKVGEGAAGIAFGEGSVLCVPDAERDPRFAGRGAGAYDETAFAIVPLVCLGVPVGVLCLTGSEEAETLSEPEHSVLRLLGMQVSEFLAADPEVEGLLQRAQSMEVEGIETPAERPGDDDAELARVVCEAVAEEVEPERVLGFATAAVARRLGAAPVAIHLLTPDRTRLELEAESDAGVVGDRSDLAVDRGLVGHVIQSGQLVAAPAPEDDPRFDAEVDTPSDGLVRPLLCLPVKLRGKVIGVLRLFLEEGGAASPRTAEVLAAAFSAAVRNVLLYRSLLQSIEEVADARRRARS